MAQTSVRVHSTGWYTNVVSVIWFFICILVSICMYTKTFWVWALARLQTYVSLHNMGLYTKVSVMEYVYLWSYVCMQRGSKCEHSQGHKQVWECTERVDIPTYPWYDSWYMYTCEYRDVYKKRFWVWELAGAQAYVSLRNMSLYTKVSVMEYIYMYTCDHMYVCKEVLSASTRKGTDICEFAQHGFIYKGICDMTYVCLWVYACTQRGSKFEHSQGHRHRWVRTTRSHTRKYL